MSPRATDPDIDAVLAACRALVGISARSLSAVSDDVSMLELRMLTVTASRGALSLSELAAAVGMHMSRASRGCERMVQEGLLDRTIDPDDRRTMRLTVTRAGRAILRRVADTRRNAVAPALAAMPVAERARLTDALAAFTAALGEPHERELWSLGWATS